MTYLSFKSMHILSMILLFGSAFYKFMADLHGDVSAIYTTNKHVVLADWLFTTPAILIRPITGYCLLHELPFSITTPWLLCSIVLYLLAAGCGATNPYTCTVQANGSATNTIC